MSANAITIRVCRCGCVHLRLTDEDGATTEAVLSFDEAAELSCGLMEAVDAATDEDGDDRPLASQEVH